MKQCRRWVAWLATLLIAASLVALPREGVVAAPIHDPLPPVVYEGDPDVPYSATPVHDRGRAQLAVNRVGFVYIPKANAFLPGPKMISMVRSLLHFAERGTRR